jgi:hypothetical protein
MATDTAAPDRAAQIEEYHQLVPALVEAGKRLLELARQERALRGHLWLGAAEAVPVGVEWWGREARRRVGLKPVSWTQDGSSARSGMRLHGRSPWYQEAPQRGA